MDVPVVLDVFNNVAEARIVTQDELNIFVWSVGFIALILTGVAMIDRDFFSGPKDPKP